MPCILSGTVRGIKLTTRFYFDTEFTDFNGQLLSAGIVRSDGAALYLVLPQDDIDKLLADGIVNPWVVDNVLPILLTLPEGTEPIVLPVEEWGEILSSFMYPEGNKSEQVQIICDWPSDHIYLMNLLLTGPGLAHPMGRQTDFTVLRHVDIYPTDVPGAVQHNALWDALAIKRWVEANK